MRRVAIVGAALVGIASPSQAADYGPLRGSQIEVSGGADWVGAYAGGQVGYSAHHANLHSAPPLNVALGGSTVTVAPFAGIRDTSAIHYGAFAGYNWQWENVILGVEANYVHVGSTVSGVNPPFSFLLAAPDGNTYSGTASGGASIHLIDYVTLRARAGWSVGTFLPYAFAAVAVGRADIQRTASVSGTYWDTALGPPPAFGFSTSASAGKDGAFLYGYAAGLGVDIALTSNIFVRAEYEYLQFGPHLDVQTAINSARVGAGVKF